MLKIKKIVLSMISSFMLFAALPSVASAYSGNWTSTYRTDYNGVSTVGTTRTSNKAATVTLRVVTGSNATVGQKTVGVAKNQTVSHTCWGQPLLARAGKVNMSGNHSPYFNE